MFHALVGRKVVEEPVFRFTRFAVKRFEAIVAEKPKETWRNEP